MSDLKCKMELRGAHKKGMMFMLNCYEHAIELLFRVNKKGKGR
jgi:hypothetical protein